MGWGLYNVNKMEKLIVFIIIAISSVSLFAQSTSATLQKNAQVGTPEINAGQQAPIDGGLSILLFLGAAYGTKNILRFKKNNKRN